MSEVERFLARQQRYRCSRLSAELTLEQCQRNRERKPNPVHDISKVLSCEGCPGLLAQASAGYVIPLSQEIQNRMAELEITPHDVSLLVEHALAGELRWREAR